MTNRKSEGSNDFDYTFKVKATASQVLDRIAEVNQWWAKDVRGTAARLNDRFSVHFGETSVNFSIAEYVPRKQIVWRVDDCNLHWLSDRKEWNGTEVRWALDEQDGTTNVHFVHKGLVPACECYGDCEAGWTHHIQDSLIKLIENGKGFPE